MDAERFDRIARAFAAGRSRRTTVRWLVGGLAGAATGLLGRSGASAGSCSDHSDCNAGCEVCHDLGFGLGRWCVAFHGPDEEPACETDGDPCTRDVCRAYTDPDDDFGNMPKRSKCEHPKKPEGDACQSATVPAGICCNDACVNPKRNRRHCGECDRRCATGRICRRGTCRRT